MQLDSFAEDKDCDIRNERSHSAGLHNFASADYARHMAKVQLTFPNTKNEPIYVSVEPIPEAFELEPGENLSLIWDGPEDGETAQIDFINDRELIIWPNGEWHQMQFLIDGEDAKSRS